MNTNSDTANPLYVGLDVHKEQTVIALLEPDRDAEPRSYGSIATTQHALERAMRRIARQQKRRLSDLHVCYEASGCGFWIARRLLQMGLHCDVIAPSLIPSRSGDRVKTDKRDAAKLARMHRSNDLVAVHVPDAVDEAIRDLCRARTDAVDDLRRAKTRLLALLRRLGYRYDGKTHWTQAHQNYLRSLKLPDAAHNRVLEDHIATIDFHEERIARLEDEMRQLLDGWQREPLVRALMAFKGFKLVAAMVTVSEIGTFSRFAHPKKLMAFLGLVPSENSSGTSRRQGAISKCGNPHARWLLVEQATHYRVPPKVSPQLSERQSGAPRWIRELSWKTQTRLSHRFSVLRKRGLHHNKIKVSIARELAAFVWELGTRFEAKQAAA
ncbi:IS110 family transposase [Luteolibacter marinus]|uniref:IS110 family transposase n=1 Tax=Luteolibacter marinus TaxID=2776705 RepID=UPI001865EF50|nr:IS110 family transposase [Luteolibacter marinus]